MEQLAYICFMQKHILPLSAVTAAIADAIDVYFDRQVLTVKGEITDVKKYPQKKWCFLKLLEKQGDTIQTELKAVFWSTGYGSIARFEQQTGRKFTDGLEVICDVMVKYHPRFGLSLEILDIDTAHTIGNLELERQRTIERLIAESSFVSARDGELVTINQALQLPPVIKSIAVIAPPDSDGLRDFIKEITQNSYGYAFRLEILETQVQGDAASAQLLKAIRAVADHPGRYDALAIVRGGGSNTDFKPFDHYDVCEAIAACPVPVFTGIGHDRNTSIADMMGRQLKTPTKVASYFIEHNMRFEDKVEQLYQRLLLAVHRKISGLKEQLKYIDRTLEQLHPQKVLNKGYALLRQEGEIVEDITALRAHDTIDIQTRQHMIKAIIKNIETL